MFQRILVAIDFSDASVQALEWTADSFPEADLTLFHSLEEVSASSDVRHSLSGQIDPRAGAALDVRSNMELLAEKTGRDCEIVLHEGPPARELKTAATAMAAELVVLGAHSKDPPGRTAEAVVDAVDLPILIWRPTRRTGERTILAPLDLREGSDPVGRVAAAIADHFDARLVLLHVLPKTFQGFLRAASSRYQTEDTLRKAETSARDEMLAKVPSEYKDRLNVQAMVVRGQPGAQILTVVESETGDLIVIGKTRARKRTERALMGQVTGRALRNAPCSVLTVPL